MMVAAIAAAVVLQLVAGIVRARGWFHCVRASSADGSDVRFRDVVVAHLAGSGWNCLLPIHVGEAVKVAVMRRRLRSVPTASIAGTLVPTSIVEAGFTAILVATVLASGVVSATRLAARVPAGSRTLVLVAIGAVAVVGVFLALRRVPSVVRKVGSGLAVLRRPRVLLTRVVPWQAAARALRLVALMLVLVAAGFQLALAPALLLMALQGATPAVGPASAAARLGIVSAAFPAANGGIALTQSVQVVVIATLATSIVSVAVSVIALAIVLRTVSPRRIAAHVRAAYRDARAGDRSIARYRSSSQNARSRPASAGASPSSGTASR